MGFFKLSKAEMDRVYDVEKKEFQSTKSACKALLIVLNVPSFLLVFLPIFIGFLNDLGPDSFFRFLKTFMIVETFLAALPTWMYFMARSEFINFKKLKKSDNLYGIYGILQVKEIESSYEETSDRLKNVYYFNIKVDDGIEKFKVDKNFFEEKKEGDQILIVNLKPNEKFDMSNFKCY